MAQYNEEMNCIRPREYDGSRIVFSGINPEIKLQPHQVNVPLQVMAHSVVCLEWLTLIFPRR